MRWGLIPVVIGALAATAAADPIAAIDHGSICDSPEIPDGRSYSQRLKDNLSAMSLDLNGHVGRLSGSMVDMRLDLGTRRGKLRLGGGDQRFSLKIDSDILFEKGYARFKTRLDLAVAGKELSLQLPEFDMVPRSYEGERFVEVRLPVISGTF